MAPSLTRAERIAALLRRLAPAYEATPLLELPDLAAQLGVEQVLAKDESARALGSFKSLGGSYAALRALARAEGVEVDAVAEGLRRELPVVICASDGNHGLAVAVAGRLAGTAARVYLHAGVTAGRAERIARQGAAIVRVEGSYDDAVLAAEDDAAAGGGLLIPDTSGDPGDAVVADVMAGYGVMAEEIVRQARAARHPPATHAFVQAGVGGLAAAMATGLASWLASPGVLVVVEPEAAACVSAGLEAGHPVQVTGDLATAAAMLSCGRASAAALQVLARYGARSLAVDEAGLRRAPSRLRRLGGPATTPSGAAGVAGALAACADPASRARLRLDADSRLLLLVTEGVEGGQDVAAGRGVVG